MSTRATPCKSCGAAIIFLPTSLNQIMPCDADTVAEGDTMYVKDKHRAHFATCSDPDKHRKPRQQQRSLFGEDK